MAITESVKHCKGIGPASLIVVSNMPIKPQKMLSGVLRKRKAVTCRTRGRCSSGLLPLRSFSSHFLDVGLIDSQQNVLWFDVCVDDLTLGVEVV